MNPNVQILLFQPPLTIKKRILGSNSLAFTTTAVELFVHIFYSYKHCSYWTAFMLYPSPLNQDSPYYDYLYRSVAFGYLGFPVRAAEGIGARHQDRLVYLSTPHLLDVLHLVLDRQAVLALLHVVQLVEEAARELVEQRHEVRPLGQERDLPEASAGRTAGVTVNRGRANDGAESPSSRSKIEETGLQTVATHSTVSIEIT